VNLSHHVQEFGLLYILPRRPPLHTVTEKYLVSLHRMVTTEDIAPPPPPQQWKTVRTVHTQSRDENPDPNGSISPDPDPSSAQESHPRPRDKIALRFFKKRSMNSSAETF
jgi:hypothetical protein